MSAFAYLGGRGGQDEGNFLRIKIFPNKGLYMLFLVPPGIDASANRQTVEASDTHLC